MGKRPPPQRRGGGNIPARRAADETRVPGPPYPSITSSSIITANPATIPMVAR